jgi:outer membrane receptor protein involved in Fe transport
MHESHRMRRGLLPYLACAALASFDAAEAAGLERRDAVEVNAIRVVPAVEVPLEHIPSNVQTLEAGELRETQATNFPELMRERLQSVTVNEVQGNPYQLDVNYRGFTASPLLGVAQGLSVYVDGVRVNEPFGDIVNWDLIPISAIDGLALIPGSNPLYGLNTLGGALVLHTRRGDTSPGSDFALSAGSFGRRRAELAHGGAVGGLHVFGALSGFEENGWRDHSPSRVRNAFGKVGGRTGGLDWDVALTHAKTNLIGNGLVPEAMLSARRDQIYTRPDITANHMTMVALNAAYAVAADQRITATVYQRRSRTRTLNGDVNDDFEDPPDAAGVENRTHTRQHAHGLALQWWRETERYRLMAGASYDRSRSRFEQTESEGDLDATRAVVPALSPELDAQLRGATRSIGVYITATYALRPDLHVTAGARYNTARVRTVDELNDPAGPNLNADYTYRKLNPLVGATWQAAPALAVYGSYSQGNRVPSPIELGCADPAQPCTLPNALQSDPFLKQVVARTIEVGVRHLPTSGWRWSAALFRTRNADDILFVGTSASASRGFFQNFGRTRRSGLELAFGAGAPILQWNASYSYVQATFESPACIVAQSNSTAGASAACAPEQIEVRPGNTIPGIPRHTLKLNVDARPAAGVRIGASASAHGSQYVRGNENNAHRADGATFSGSGRLAGFALVDLTASYTLARSWELFGRVSNVFDRKYATAGQLGRTAFDAQGAFIPDSDDWPNAQFVGPGAPRAGWLGLRYRTKPR